MSNEIHNIDFTFRTLIKDKQFLIPAYQRAYAWTDKQIIPFVKDLLENSSNVTKYYLGHYILEKENDDEYYQIVDGQQRLTTIKLFLAVCNYLAPGEGDMSLELKVADYDNDKFQELIKCVNIKNGARCKDLEETASMQRVKDAILLFFTIFEEGKDLNSKLPKLNTKNIADYIKVISNAYSSCSIYSNKAVATQIFELHNTRGISLTEVEKVKAYLMKYIYSYSKNKDEDIKEIQRCFGKIYQYEEIAANYAFRGEMDLEEILMFHLRAIDDGNKSEQFSTPWAKTGENGSLSYIQRQMEKLDDKSKIIYALNVAREFEKTMQIISEEFKKADDVNSIVGDVLLLAKGRSMIFLLRLFRSIHIYKDGEFDKRLFDVLMNWEQFIFGYEFISRRGHFYNAKSNRGDFNGLIFKQIKDESLIEDIDDIIKKYYENSWFAYRLPDGIKSSVFKYIEQDANEVEYVKEWLNSEAYGSWNKLYFLLYKYELSKNDSIREPLRSLFKENRISIDHIISRNISWNECIGSDKPTEEQRRYWDGNVSPIMNGIGNLVLLNTSKNSEASNKSPINHYDVYKTIGLTSESYSMAKKMSTDNFFQWHNIIESRSNAIYEFLKVYLKREMI